MRAIKIGLCGVIVLGLFGVVTIGQAGGGGQQMLGGMVLDLKAPTEVAVDWPAAKIDAGFREMAAKKLETARVLEGGAFNMNVRRETAPEESAAVHGKTADLYLIRSGEATLTTGGELVNRKPWSGTAGNMNGTGIRNGVARTIKPGDIIFIPAGVPHQITGVNGDVQFVLFKLDTK